MKALGLEPHHETKQNSAIPGEGGAESGAVPGIDTDLVKILEGIPTLPGAVREVIRAIIEAAQK